MIRILANSIPSRAPSVLRQCAHCTPAAASRVHLPLRYFTPATSISGPDKGGSDAIPDEWINAANVELAEYFGETVQSNSNTTKATLTDLLLKRKQGAKLTPQTLAAGAPSNSNDDTSSSYSSNSEAHHHHTHTHTHHHYHTNNVASPAADNNPLPRSTKTQLPGPLSDRVMAESFCRRWINLWSNRELDLIMSFFAEDCRFVSPKAQLIVGQAELIGKYDLRKYWQTALDRIQHIRFTYQGFLLDQEARTLQVIYRAIVNDSGYSAVELWKFNDAGLITYGEAFEGRKWKKDEK